MSSRTTCRGTTRAALLDLLGKHPTLKASTVQLARQIPAEVAAEHVLLATITGSYEIRNMQAARKQRRDTFTIKVFIGAGQPGATAVQAETRALELFAALDDVLADKPTLGGVKGLQWAQLGTVNGPDVQATNEGQAAFIECDVDCVAELI